MTMPRVGRGGAKLEHICRDSDVSCPIDISYCTLPVKVSAWALELASAPASVAALALALVPLLGLRGSLRQLEPSRL